MSYVEHKIKESGHIEILEIIDGKNHRYVIAPNQNVERYTNQIESDPDYTKYHTQENAENFEAMVLADLPTEKEMLESKRRSMSTEKWRLEIILEEDGLLDQVNGAVSQADKRTQKAWNKAPSINRYSKALEGIRKGLGLTHEQVDDIFKRADEIEI